MSESRNTVEPKIAYMTGQRTEFLGQKVGTRIIGQPDKKVERGRCAGPKTHRTGLSEFGSALTRGQDW